MPPQYDPLTQEDDTLLDGDRIQHNNNTTRGGLFPRPPIYYGEGPFDAPSSDDEDAITEKDPTNPLNRAEHGVLLNPGSVDSGLYVGGQKVRSHELLA